MTEPSDLLNRMRRFALAALEFSRRLPNTPQARASGDPFYRACASADACYRAAQRVRPLPEVIAKLSVAVQELDESVTWLEQMRDAKIASDPSLLAEAEQLRAAIVRSLGTARQIQKTRERRVKRAGVT